MIDSNAAILTPNQTALHVDALNRGGEQALPLEWEIAVIHAFSRMGIVRYEPTDFGAKRPDVHFTLSPASRVKFLADVTTVSNAGRTAENPIDELRDLLLTTIRASGLSGNRFFLRVGGSEEGKPGKRVVRLGLPRRGSAAAVLGERIEGLVALCRERPWECHRLHVSDDRIDVEIDYDPTRLFFGMTHLEYSAPRSLVRNPFYNKLDEKAAQLAGVKAPVPKGVILCAADTKVEERGRGARFGIGAIIRRLFRQHRSVDFVLVLSSTPVQGSFERRRARLYSRLYTSRIGKRRLGKRGVRILRLLHRRLPAPDASGRLALAIWRRSNRLLSYPFSTWTMTDRSIRFSARRLLQLLAGEISDDEFLSSLRLGSRQHNVFRRWLQEGRSLVNARITTESDKDDDWVTLTVGDPDRAISRFRSPHSRVHT